jgi:hypothetical protein
MAQTVNVIVAAEDRERLLAIAGDRNRPLKHVQRASIILLSAARLPVAEVARRAGVKPPCRLALAAALRRGTDRRDARSPVRATRV